MAKFSRRVPPKPASLAPDTEYIFRPWITTRDGRRIYARDVGLAAFRFPKRY